MRCLLLCFSCIVYFFSISSYNTSNAMLSCRLPAFISTASVKLCLLNTLYVLRRQSICCVRPYGRYRFLFLLLKQGFFLAVATVAVKQFLFLTSFISFISFKSSLAYLLAVISNWSFLYWHLL